MKKTNHSDLALSVFSQMEVMCLLFDLNSRCILSNKNSADLCGFENEEQMLGTNAFDMRCHAVEFAESFIKQDDSVRSTQKTHEYLDIHTYADGVPHIFLTKKSPFYQEGKLAGVLCICSGLQNETIQKIAGEMIQLDQRFYGASNGRSYVLNSHYHADFSEREMECLFYWVRGYTAKEIGKKLGLSDRTIETYFDRLKMKSGLEKKAELVDYAFSRGLINYIPKNLLHSEFAVKLS